MALLTPSVLRNTKGYFTATRNSLSAADTLTYVSGIGQLLELYNTTAASVTVTIVGNAAGTLTVPGLHGTINVSTGLPITVAASSTVSVNLDTISAYLAGSVVAVTGGTGVTAHLYN